jgi:hypothetical protein
MILRTLKSNRSINLIFFPIVGILFWLKSLLDPFTYDFFPGENEGLLFSPLFKTTEKLEVVQVALSLLFVLLIAVLMQVINARFSFIRIRTKLPPLLFIIVISGLTELHTLHPIFPAAIFLLLAIYSLFSTFEQVKPFSHIFNAGFLFGIGTLFYFNLIILLPAFIIAIFILSREISWRSFLILLIGFLLPFIFTFSYAALTERTLEILKVFEVNILTPVNHFRTNFALHGFLTVLILLTLMGSLMLLKQYDSKKVSSRKFFTIFFIIFVLGLLSFVFIPVTSQEMLVIIVIPVTYLISNLFVFMKSRFWSELLFILLLAIVIFMQFSDKFMLNG